MGRICTLLTKNIRRVTYLTRRIFFILFVIVYPQCGNHCGKLSPFCTFVFLVLFLFQFIYVLFLIVFSRVDNLFFMLDLSVFLHIFICFYLGSFNAFLSAFFANRYFFYISTPYYLYLYFS